MQTDFSTLEIKVQGHLAEIHLACPGRRNAISNTLHAELIRAFLALTDMPGLRAVVFAAQGKVFCAGGDFELILEDRAHPQRRQALAENARQLYKAVTELPVPIVVALQGDAVGLGATLALGCDAIFACRTARISDPHVVIGLAAGDGGCVLWPQSAGLLRAKRYLLSGDRLSAVDAHAMGLVTDLVDSPEAVYPAARAFAERVAGLPPLAVQATKRALNHAARLRAAEVFDIALELELDTLYSKDVSEAISATRARRPGQFEGC